MNLRQAAEMALEALVWEVGSCPEMYAKQTADAITALRAALAEADEPVAWMKIEDPWGGNEAHFSRDEQVGWTALYTHPPRRKPLTVDQIDTLCTDGDGLPASHIEFARAVERAHGIGGDE